MTHPWIEPSLLERDNMQLLELSAQEADCWVACLFERIRPNMPVIQAMLAANDPDESPVDLETLMLFARHTVREVAVEMAGALLTGERQKRLFPLISAYCDQLLAEDRALDALFIQQGLIRIQSGAPAANNPLLVEMCVRALVRQIQELNVGNPGAKPC